MLLLLAAFAQAACPATSADLLVSLEDAEAAFGGLDLAAFRAATDAAAEQVGCVGDVLPRPLVARLHRAQGLRAFVDGDVVKATAAFASARAIEPGYQFPEALVPAEHPVRERYVQQDPASGGATPLDAPVDGVIEVDGRPGDPLPTTRPAVVQYRSMVAGVQDSLYHWPGAPLFDYPVADGRVATDAPPPLERRSHASIPLVVGAAVALGVSGGAYAVASGAHDAYYAAETQPADLEGLRARTNGFFLTSVGAGVAGVGLGLGAVVVGKW